ncbi:MAG: hypothetical protein LUH10_00495, partial [Tannerellaceae bacterium]|nr:hypothetical protein [Tannerellaceae bacterium]
MPIYKGEKKVGAIYKAEEEISSVLKGSNLVYQNRKSIPDEWKYIEIVVDMPAQDYFIIPFSNYAANGLTYELNVTVKNPDYPTIGPILTTGTVDTATGTGLSVHIPPGENTIRIEPNGEAYAGWGRTFGFYSNTTGCNTTNNKNKLVRIINDPDYAYLLSDDNTGDFFRYYQYHGCRSLTAPAEEVLPDSVNSIG